MPMIRLIASAAAVLMMLLLSPALRAQNLPAYEAVVADEISGQKLSLDCVIAAPVDEATLQALAQKVYDDYQGDNYKNVFIMWYLPNYEIGVGAWGLSNFQNGDWDVRIMALQG